MIIAHTKKNCMVNNRKNGQGQGGEKTMYWVTGILGLAFALAPFVLGYSNNAAALWTSILIGAATIVVSWIEGAQADREQWEYWTAAVLGVIAVVAPFIFGFGAEVVATWTSVILGGLIALFAGSKLTSGQWRKT